MRDSYVRHVVHADNTLLARQFCEVLRLCFCLRGLLRCILFRGSLIFHRCCLWPVDIDKVDHFHTNVVIIGTKKIVVQYYRLDDAWPLRRKSWPAGLAGGVVTAAVATAAAGLAVSICGPTIVAAAATTAAISD